MATLLLEGFDAVENPEDYYGSWLNVASYFQTTTTIARTGRSLVCTCYDAQGHLTIPFGADLETVFFGVAFYLVSRPAVIRKVFAFMMDGEHQIELYVDVDGTLVLKRGTTVLGTSTGVIVPGSWHYIEVELKITNSISTDDCRVWLDEVEEINPSSGDSAAQTDLYVNELELAGLGSGGPACYFDDMYVSDSENLGPVAVVTLFPNANGTYSDFVGSDADSVDNFDLVNQALLDVATYVSGVPTDQDSYAFDTLAAGTIKSIQVDSVMQRDGSGTVKNLIRIGTTDYTGAELGIFDEFVNVKQIWDVSPATAVAWTTAEVNAAEFGQELQ